MNASTSFIRDADDAVAHLSRADWTDAPGCRYGTRVEAWGPVAYALAELHADSEGGPVTPAMLDHATAAVVNDDETVAEALWEHRHAVTADLEDILDTDVLDAARGAVAAVVAREGRPFAGGTGYTVTLEGVIIGHAVRHARGDWEAYAVDGTFLECWDTRREAVGALVSEASR